MLNYSSIAYKQADTSPEQLKRIITEWAGRNGFELVRWYEDAGKSGTSFDRRPAFIKLKSYQSNRRDPNRDETHPWWH